MIEVNEDYAKKLRSMLPKIVGDSVIIDSKSVYYPDGDFRAFLVLRRDSLQKATIFHFDISRNGKLLREDFEVNTTPNLTTFHLADHEQNFNSDDKPRCGNIKLYRCNQMNVEGKPFDENGVGVSPEEALGEFELVIDHAWEHQLKQGKSVGAG
jgi:hypothetical protein